MAVRRGRRRPSKVHGFAIAVLTWTLAAFGCGGKAATTGQSSGDGDGDLSGDGDSPGDGDGDTTPIDRSCADTSDCLLVSATCCDTCGTQTLESLTAIRVTEHTRYSADLCRDQQGCPDCLVMGDPNLYAVCNDGTCEAVDLRTQPASECSGPDECILIPDACCECGASADPSQMVAIHWDRVSEFAASQCSEIGLGEPVGCDGCLWSPPFSYGASCSSGRCTILQARQ